MKTGLILTLTIQVQRFLSSQSFLLANMVGLHSPTEPNLEKVEMHLLHMEVALKDFSKQKLISFS